MARLKFHRPRIYRYKVAESGFRIGLNRYPKAWIGAYLVVDSYAYCIKWGWAR